MSPLSKSRRPLRAEDLLCGDLRNTVGQGELQVLGDELLDVGTLDVISLLQLDDTQDL